MKGQLLTSRDARPRLRQHKSPCADCPFARWSLKGWLGGLSVGRWLFIAHHDGRVECHTRISKQGESYHCAGTAIYRANVAKFVEPENLRLPADRKKVFATPLEFAEHHSEGKIKTHAQVRELMTAEMLAHMDVAQRDVIAVTLK